MGRWVLLGTNSPGYHRPIRWSPTPSQVFLRGKKFSRFMVAPVSTTVDSPAWRIKMFHEFFQTIIRDCRHPLICMDGGKRDCPKDDWHSCLARTMSCMRTVCTNEEFCTHPDSFVTSYLRIESQGLRVSVHHSPCWRRVHYQDYSSRPDMKDDAPGATIIRGN